MCDLTFSLLAAILAIVYLYVKYLYSYWERRGIPYLKPSFPFGNFGKTFIQKLPLSEQFAELYRSTTEPFIGIFMLQSPMLLIRDPNLIRSILITDFQYFTDRRFYLNEKDEPLTAHLGALRGQQWRDRRTKIGPIFTPNKVKMIFSVFLDCGNQLQQHLFKVVNANQSMEISDVIACYTSNVMASAVFGIDIDCFANPNNPFRNAERKLFEINVKNGFRFMGWLLQPTLLKWSGIKFIDRDVEEYFLNLVAKTLEMREHQNVVRKDIFQFLVELRNNVTSTSTDNNEWKTINKNSEQKSLTFKEIAAETFSFFIAGVKATSLVTAYCLYEIAKHPDVQQKIHAEIDRIMDKYNDQLTYESVNELKYLDYCLDETLRKYQLLHLSRVCVKDYKIPGTNVTIEKGTTIVISPNAVQYDENFYPNPKKFDPTRFSSENKAVKSINDVPYLPFGDGPRACIGQRMSKICFKIGVCSILQNYYIELEDRHIGKEIEFSVNLHPIGGIHLKLNAKKIKKLC